MKCAINNWKESPNKLHQEILKNAILKLIIIFVIQIFKWEGWFLCTSVETRILRIPQHEKTDNTYKKLDF